MLDDPWPKLLELCLKLASQTLPQRVLRGVDNFRNLGGFFGGVRRILQHSDGWVDDVFGLWNGQRRLTHRLDAIASELPVGNNLETDGLSGCGGIVEPDHDRCRSGRGGTGG